MLVQRLTFRNGLEQINRVSWHFNAFLKGESAYQVFKEAGASVYLQDL